MTSFFAEFVHTDNGVTCSDSGFIDLSTAQECSGAVSYAKNFNSEAHYQFEGSFSGIPKGCIMHESGQIFFNTHTTGGRKSSYSSICNNGNTQF